MHLSALWCWAGHEQSLSTGWDVTCSYSVWLDRVTTAPRHHSRKASTLTRIRLSNTIGSVWSLQRGPRLLNWAGVENKNGEIQKNWVFTSSAVSDKERKQSHALHWWRTLTQNYVFYPWGQKYSVFVRKHRRHKNVSEKGCWVHDYLCLTILLLIKYRLI